MKGFLKKLFNRSENIQRPESIESPTRSIDYQYSEWWLRLYLNTTSSLAIKEFINSLSEDDNIIAYLYIYDDNIGIYKFDDKLHIHSKLNIYTYTYEDAYIIIPIKDINTLANLLRKFELRMQGIIKTNEHNDLFPNYLLWEDRLPLADSEYILVIPHDASPLWLLW